MRALLAPFLLATSSVVVLPLEFEDGTPIVAATVGGSLLRLAIDTGGYGELQLNRNVIERIEAIRREGSVVVTNAFGQKEERALFQAVVELGSTRFDELTIHVSNAESGWGPPGDGVFGRAFLSEFVTEVDYPANTIRLHPLGTNPCSGTPVPLIPHPQGIPVSDVKTDHGAMMMLWDTGANYSFVKAQTSRDRGLEISEELYLTSLFEMGSADFGPMDLVEFGLTKPAGVDGFLGYNFFFRHVVCLDMSEMTVTVRMADDS